MLTSLATLRLQTIQDQVKLFFLFLSQICSVWDILHCKKTCQSSVVDSLNDLKHIFDIYCYILADTYTLVLRR